MLLCRRLELPLLVAQRLLSARQLALLLRKGRQSEHAGEIGLEQALLGSIQLGQGMVQGGLPGLEFLGEPLSAMRAA